MEITPVLVGLPSEFATQLIIRVLTFDTRDTTATIYFAAESNIASILVEGNITLTEAEWTATRCTNELIEDLVLSKLGLTRAPATTSSTTTIAPTTTTTTL
jgi:hypothetical protein